MFLIWSVYFRIRWCGWSNSFSGKIGRDLWLVIILVVNSIGKGMYSKFLKILLKMNNSFNSFCGRELSCGFPPFS